MAVESAAELTPELKQLIEAVLEERCSADDLARLEHLLVSDVDARRSYVQYISTLAGVRRCLRGHASSLISQFEEPLGDADAQIVLDHVRSLAVPMVTVEAIPPSSPPVAIEDTDKTLAKEVTPHRSSSTGWTLKSASLAVLLLVSVTLVAWNFRRDSEEPLAENTGPAAGKLAVDPVDQSDDLNSTTENEDFVEPVYVARVTDSHEAVWAGIDSPTQGVSMLAIGQECEIASGLIEIVFDNGAKVLLEGPAKLVFDSRTQATLAFGQLTAQVPQQAIGFTIQTPAVNVVDLGTEFGVRVSEQGMTDVAVFSGEVIAAPRVETGTAGQSVRVLADELRRFIAPDASDEPLGAPTFTKSIPSSVEISNPGFEFPKIGGWLVRELTGWTIASQPAWEGLPNAGVMLVTPERLQLPATSEGHQWGFLETRRAVDGGVHNTSAFQPVATLAAKTLYRLQVTIGREGFQSGPKSHLYPFSSFEGVEIGLWAGPDENSGPTEPLRVVRDPAPSLKAGGTETVTLEYLSPSELPPGSQTMFVKLSIDGQDWCRVLFDNVRLDAVSNSVSAN